MRWLIAAATVGIGVVAYAAWKGRRPRTPQPTLLTPMPSLPVDVEMAQMRAWEAARKAKGLPLQIPVPETPSWSAALLPESAPKPLMEQPQMREAIAKMEALIAANALVLPQKSL